MNEQTDAIMSPSLCIFDLDGTILNTLPSMLYTVNETLASFSLPPISEDACRRFVGNATDYLLEHALREAGDTDLVYFREAKERYLSLFRESCTRGVTPYSGIQNQLERLKATGMILAVFSNKPQEMAEHVIRTAYGNELFACVLGQQEGRPRKPDPAGIRFLMGKYQVHEDSCCYVGDSETDILTGRNAGIFTVICSWGYRSRRELEAHHPVLMIHRTADLFDAVTKHLTGPQA